MRVLVGPLGPIFYVYIVFKCVTCPRTPCNNMKFIGFHENPVPNVRVSVPDVRVSVPNVRIQALGYPQLMHRFIHRPIVVPDVRDRRFLMSVPSTPRMASLLQR